MFSNPIGEISDVFGKPAMKLKRIKAKAGV